MPTELWCVMHLLTALFWLWVARWGGAQKLEGTFASGCLISVFAPSWSAEGLRFFAWFCFIGGVLWFVAGMIDPNLRLQY